LARIAHQLDAGINVVPLRRLAVLQDLGAALARGYGAIIAPSASTCPTRAC
jgi:hypothetical protein